MPPLPDVPKVLKTSLVWSDGVNNDIVTRLHHRYGGAAPSDAQLNQFCHDVTSAYTADLVGAVFTGITLIRIDSIDLTSASGAVGTWSDGIVGTRAGPPVGIDTAFVTSYEIARRYRGGHPRGYWPFGVAGDLDNPQTWLTSFRDGVIASLNPFFDGVLAAGWAGAGGLSQVNVSYYHGFTVITNPITGRARNVPTVRGVPVVDSIASYIARLRLGTQRRRAQYA